MPEVFLTYSPPQRVSQGPDAVVRHTLWTDGWTTIDYADGRSERIAPTHHEEDDDDN